MKALKYIFAVLLAAGILSANSYAQSQTVNTGYVFIDGKYIEPPYKIKAKKDFITINGIKALKLKKPKPKKKLKIPKEFPGYPPDSLKGGKVLDAINPKTGNSYVTDAYTYYYNKYGKEKAKQLIVEYYKKLPGITILETKPHFKIITSNSKIPTYIELGTINEYNKKLKTKRQLRKEFNEKKEMYISSLEESLELGDALFFNENKWMINGIKDIKKLNNFIKDINDIKLSDKEKYKLLREKYGFYDFENSLMDFIKTGIDTINLKEKLQKRINN